MASYRFLLNSRKTYQFSHLLDGPGLVLCAQGTAVTAAVAPVTAVSSGDAVNPGTG